LQAAAQTDMNTREIKAERICVMSSFSGVVWHDQTIFFLFVQGPMRFEMPGRRPHV
jgi:hypothetical protein